MKKQLLHTPEGVRDIYNEECEKKLLLQSDLLGILLLGSIPLLYFLNKDWYETLMFTGFGKVLLAISGTVVFISVAAVSKHIRPIEYKR